MTHPSISRPSPLPPAGFDTGTNEAFYEYYKAQSLSPRTMARFRSIADAVLRIIEERQDKVGGALDVLDVGCGAGAQSRIWTDRGHRYQGIDINQPLIELARERAAESGRAVQFHVGSATSLPFPDASFDVCLVPELLEHVDDWQSCVNEAVRVLRPGGALFLSTSNRLCPKQEEFTLPAYSWYPAWLKRHIVRRSLTDRPEWANHAKYPAVHWFSFYQLRAFLGERGFDAFDRFDMMRLDDKPRVARHLVAAVRAVPLLRLFGHMATPGTVLIARHRKA